jgi:hypothetical protein
MSSKTKSEPGAVATGRTTQLSEVGAQVLGAFEELTFRLVATAPSSDFVLPDKSIPAVD